jgi:hypothetical protein
MKGIEQKCLGRASGEHNTHAPVLAIPFALWENPEAAGMTRPVERRHDRCHCGYQ